MKASVISMVGMRFFDVKISPQKEVDNEFHNIEAFDFEGVEIGEASDTYLLNEEDPRLYAVILSFSIDNEDGKIAPYNIEVTVIGHFKVGEGVPQEKRYNMVTVNGCSMLYGAIRELVMNITARSVHGMLVLPTANFLDKIKPENTIQQQGLENKNIEPKPKRKKRITKSGDSA